MTTEEYKEMIHKDIAELEAIQKKVRYNHPLAKAERLELYFGLLCRINTLKENIGDPVPEGKTYPPKDFV